MRYHTAEEINSLRRLRGAPANFYRKRFSTVEIPYRLALENYVSIAAVLI